MKKFDVKTQWAKYKECFLTVHQYANNDHVYIGIFSAEEGPIADMTVNIAGIERFPKNYSCVDTNNCPWIVDLIKKLGIGHFEHTFLQSGFCEYPVFSFDMGKIDDYLEGEDQ